MSRSFRKNDRRHEDEDFDPFLARKAERNRREKRRRHDHEDQAEQPWFF